MPGNKAINFGPLGKESRSKNVLAASFIIEILALESVFKERAWYFSDIFVLQLEHWYRESLFLFNLCVLCTLLTNVRRKRCL
jgi:hypothetical protein